MVTVPNVLPGHAAPPDQPGHPLLQDHFQKPYPFPPDVVVAIDEMVEKKLDALTPRLAVLRVAAWSTGSRRVPKEPATRHAWLAQKRLATWATRFGTR